MRNWFRTSLVAAGALAVVSVVVVPAVLRGQAPAAPAGRGAAPAARIPRTADGKPNLNGIWQTMTGANWNLEDHGASAGPFSRKARSARFPRGRASSTAATFRTRPRRSPSATRTHATG